MPAVKKVIEQRQKAKVRAIQIKKVLKMINNDLFDQYKLDDYNIDESQDNQSSGEVDLDKIKDLNIS